MGTDTETAAQFSECEGAPGSEDDTGNGVNIPGASPGIYIYIYMNIYIFIYICICACICVI